MQREVRQRRTGTARVGQVSDLPSSGKKAGRSPALLGVVLAGGKSTRMGREKARLRVAGEPLWRRQMRVLREAGMDSVIVVRGRGQRALGRDVPHVRDVVADAGPMGGLHAALRATDARWIAVLAVDMPAMDADWFVALRKRCRRGVGAVAQHEGGFEPLAAIYPREALPMIVRRLERGERSMQALVRALVRRRRLRVVRLAEAERGRMRNWNSPADRAAR